MSVHTIRLAGPWERQRPGDSDTQRVTLPQEISSGDELRRKFNRPSGLTEDSTVRIVLTSTGAAIQLQLNGQDVVPVADAADQFDVSRQLLEFNTLTVTSSAPSTLTLAVLAIAE